MCTHPDPEGMAGSGSAPPKGLAPRRLLVINTDSGFLKCAGDVGGALGYRVCSSSRAGDFVGLYEEFAPSVVIFDFFSAGMDGIELMNWLRERGSDAQLLLTSARESFLLGFVRELAEARGFHNLELLIEPANPKELSDLLRRHLTADTFTTLAPVVAQGQ